jgi:hypothetical protein
MLVAALAMLAGARTAHACSMRAGWSPVMPPRSAFFLGVATPDTVRAGPGTVKSMQGSGHFGPTGRGDVYGQIVTVTRPGGAAPPSATRAVLVPWDYDPACAPLQWGSSARWIPPGTAGLFSASLRDSVHWADGIPTYDVHYTAPEPYRGAPTMMTPVQVMDLLSRLTVSDKWPAAPEAFAPVLDWARANPELATRWPATDLLRSTAYERERAELARIRSPLLGTYRVRLTVPGEGERVFFLRTFANLITTWNPTDTAPPTLPLTLDPFNARPIRGYTMMVVGSDGSAPPGRDMNREAYIDVPVAASRRTTDVTEWTATMENAVLTRQFRAPADVRWRNIVESAGAIVASFALRPGGALVATGTAVLPDGRTLSVILKRVSLITNE